MATETLIAPLSKQELIFKALCEESLLAFTAYMFKHMEGRKLTIKPFHKRIVSKLEACARGEITRLIISIPPRHGKTFFMKCFAAWCLANNSRASFMNLSYAEDLVLKSSKETKDIVMHEAFQRFWPMKMKLNTNGAIEWRNTDGGGMYSAPTGGKVTGFGAGISPTSDGAKRTHTGALFLDDPLKPLDARSEVVRTEINERYNNTIRSRLNSPETPVIVIMQRIHEDDMAGYLINGGSGDDWDYLCIPVYDENEEPIWPELLPKSALQALERADKYTFASQYMQCPIPAEGGLFKVEKFKVIGARPTDVTEWVRAWDKAGSEAAGCYTVGVLMGKRADGRYVVADVVRGQWSALDRENVIKNTAISDGFMTSVWIEREPGSGGKESAEATIRNLAGFNIQSENPTGDKETRARPFACQVEAGNVDLVAGEWNKEYTDELKFFPFGKYKDQCDSSALAFNKLAVGGFDIFALV